MDISIEEFIESEKQNLDDFWKHWILCRHDEPEDFPKRLHREDWLEAYFTYVNNKDSADKATKGGDAHAKRKTKGIEE